MAKAKKTAKRKTKKAVKRGNYSKTKTTKKMAKKKKAGTRRRRRSIGATGNELTTIAAMAGGAIAARFLVSKVGSNVNPKIMAVAQIAAGAYILPSVMKNATAKAVGAGMAVNGAVELVRSFGIISGIDETVNVDYVGEIQQTIAGPGVNAEIAGPDDEDGDDIGSADMVQDYELASGMGRINSDDDDDM